MTALAIRLTQSAEADIAAILAWTREHFGTRQADIYARTLAMTLADLTQGPDVPGAKTRDDLAPGIRLLPVARRGRRGRHLVVFRIGGKHRIDVLRILHDSMDIERHVDS